MLVGNLTLLGNAGGRINLGLGTQAGHISGDLLGDRGGLSFVQCSAVALVSFSSSPSVAESKSPLEDFFRVH